MDEKNRVSSTKCTKCQKNAHQIFRLNAIVTVVIDCGVAIDDCRFSDRRLTIDDRECRLMIVVAESRTRKSAISLDNLPSKNRQSPIRSPQSSALESPKR